MSVTEQVVNKCSPPDAKIHLFRSLFRGRNDVYPLRFESRRTGRSGYQPACANEWVRGVCEKPRVKCYAGDFHMDVIPSRPSRSQSIFGQTRIAVPDKELQVWLPSNPKGYAYWFLEIATRNQLSPQSSAVNMTELVRASTEPAPEQPTGRWSEG